MPSKTPTVPSPAAQKARILERAEAEKVKFLRLQFTDILGTIKNVEIPDRQFEDALNGEIMFDGSSIEGFVRIEESDMYLKPDLDTFQVLPWRDASGARVAGNPDGLVRALRTLQAAAEEVPLPANPASAHLFIVNPLSGRGLSGLFSTHPPLEERIARLLGRPATG